MGKKDNARRRRKALRKVEAKIEVRKKISILEQEANAIRKKIEEICGQKECRGRQVHLMKELKSKLSKRDSLKKTIGKINMSPLNAGYKAPVYQHGPRSSIRPFYGGAMSPK